MGGRAGTSSLRFFHVGRMSITVTLIIIAASCIQNALARTDPETERIRVIFIGEIPPPYPDWIESEPRFTLQRVNCGIHNLAQAEAKKYTRQYLPKTYERLLEYYDVFIFEDFTLRVLPSGALEMFQKSISEEGLGILLVEYVFWSKNLNHIDMWMESTFYDVFPGRPFIGQLTVIGRMFYEVVTKEPIFGIPDVSKWQMDQADHGTLYAKPGSTTHAIWKGDKTAAVVSREYGKGMGLHIAHGWDNIPVDTKMKYRYLPDLIFNMLLFVADVPPPSDLAVVHHLRTELIQLGQRKKAAISVLDFADKFGANTAKAEKELFDIDELVQVARKQYILSMYDESLATLTEATRGFTSFEETAIDLKSQALFWTYTVEWITVTATLMLCIQTLWTLMIRRRLYRSIDTTRLDRIREE
jgi:hypothetical protein